MKHISNKRWEFDVTHDIFPKILKINLKNVSEKVQIHERRKPWIKRRIGVIPKGGEK